MINFLTLSSLDAETLGGKQFLLQRQWQNENRTNPASIWNRVFRSENRDCKQEVRDFSIAEQSVLGLAPYISWKCHQEYFVNTTLQLKHHNCLVCHWILTKLEEIKAKTADGGIALYKFSAIELSSLSVELRFLLVRDHRGSLVAGRIFYSPRLLRRAVKPQVEIQGYQKYSLPYHSL